MLRVSIRMLHHMRLTHFNRIVATRHRLGRQRSQTGRGAMLLCVCSCVLVHYPLVVNHCVCRHPSLVRRGWAAAGGSMAGPLSCDHSPHHTTPWTKAWIRPHVAILAIPTAWQPGGGVLTLIAVALRAPRTPTGSSKALRARRAVCVVAAVRARRIAESSLGVRGIKDRGIR